MSRSSLRQQALFAQRQVNVRCRECVVTAPDGASHALQILGTVRAEQVPELLPAEVVNCLAGSPAPVVAVIQEPSRCTLSLEQHSARQTPLTEVVTLLSPRYTFCVNVRHADVFVNLSAAFRTMQGSTNDIVVCSTLYGDRLHALQQLPSIAVLHAVPDLVHFPHFSLSPQEVAAATCVSTGLPMVFALPAAIADAWWLGFPASTLHALGVDCIWEHYPVQAGGHAVLTLQSGLDFYCLPEDVMQSWMRVQLFLAMLRHDELTARNAGQPLQEVEVDLVCDTLWQGVLPQDFAFQALEDRWTLASEVMHMPLRARFFSGAFEQLPTVRLDIVQDTPPYLHRRRSTGAILLNVHPEIRGGGTKEEAHRAIKAELGHLCLGKGCGLAEVSRAVGQLVAKAGLAKLQALLRLPTPDEQWTGLQSLLHAQGIRPPVADDTADQAARRIQAATRRRKLFQQPILSSDFTLVSGFFVNEDGHAAPVLQDVVPGAKGVVLMNADAAKDALQHVQAQAFEALAIVVIGADCPQKDKCCGNLHFPAHSRRGEGQVLLSGCWHNVGRVALRPDLKRCSDVKVTDTANCLFQAFSDEWSHRGTWDSFTKNPVRHASDVLRQGGLDHILAQPWARAFRRNQAPSTPELCDQLQFCAKVEHSRLPDLLQMSGHNGIYVTPRKWDGRILEGWVVIWMASDKSEVAKMAMTLQHQAGLVRSRHRFGIRAPEAHYEEMFRKLKPLQAMPDRFQVQHLFKLSPIPPGADAAAVVSWAKALQWRIKVLKPLGPQQWLVGSEAVPPEGFLSFNGVAILVLPVPQRATGPKVVQAGHRALLAPPRPAQHDLPGPSSVDPLEVHDPWKDYLRKTPSAAAASARASGAPAAAPQQDGRISALEASVAELKQQQHDHMSQYQKDRSAMQLEMSAMTQQFAASMDAFQRAQTQQRDQMQQGMEELKALMLEGRRSGDHAKKPRTERDSKMEWEPGDKL